MKVSGQLLSVLAQAGRENSDIKPVKRRFYIIFFLQIYIFFNFSFKVINFYLQYIMASLHA